MQEPLNKQSEYEGLEPQQYQRLYWEDDVPVKDLRQGTVMTVLYLSLTLFLILLIVAAFVKYPDQIELPFTLKTIEQESIYKFSFPVFAYDNYIKSGDSVNIGDKLIRISSPEIVEMIYALEDSRVKKELYDVFGKEVQANRSEILRTTLKQYNNKRNELIKQLNNLKHNWAIQSEKLELDWQDALQRLSAFRNLKASGMSSTFDYKDRELAEIKTRENLITAKNNFYFDSAKIILSLHQVELDYKNAEAEISNIRLQTEGDGKNLRNTLSLNHQKLLHSFGPFDIMDGSIVLKASHAGVISYLFDGEKEIKSGNTLLKISTLKNPDYAFIKCPPGLAGKIKTAQESHLKINSFPFYEWGTLKATVQEVSRSPDEEGMYNIKLTFQNTGKLQNQLIPGLNGTAVILIDEKTLLQYFFRNVKKQYHKFYDSSLDATSHSKEK